MTNFEQCNKLIREKTGYKGKHQPAIKDWLGLLGERYGIDGGGYLMTLGRVGYCAVYCDGSPLQFDLSKPFDQQSEPFYQFILENIT